MSDGAGAVDFFGEAGEPSGLAEGDPDGEVVEGRSTGLRGAINAMCRNCLYDAHAAGSAAVQVELCSAWDCPLWKVRPVRPVGSRVPYSDPVLAELRLNPALAAFRLANPYVKPPEPLVRLDMANSGVSTGLKAKPGASGKEAA